MNEEKPKNRGCLSTLIIVILMMVAVTVFGYFLTHNYTNDNPNNTDQPSITERKANNGDIQIDIEYGFPIDINVIVIGEVNIKSLELKFIFLDSNKKEVTTKTKPVGNIDEGERITLTFTMTEFSLSENLSIRYVQCQVIGGTVSIFQ